MNFETLVELYSTYVHSITAGFTGKLNCVEIVVINQLSSST